MTCVFVNIGEITLAIGRKWRILFMIVIIALVIVICVLLTMFRTFRMAIGIDPDSITSISIQFGNPSLENVKTDDKEVIQKIYNELSNMRLLKKPFHSQTSGYYVAIIIYTTDGKTIWVYPVDDVKIDGTGYFVIKGSLSQEKINNIARSCIN